MGDDAFGRSPVGTGPFVFDNWVSGTSITLKRNDNYWGEEPKYSTLVLKFISETANRALEIESGNADIVLDPDTTDLDRLAATDGLQVVTGDSYGMSYIVFSMDDEVLGGSNVLLRQALSLALDIDTMVELSTAIMRPLPRERYAQHGICLQIAGRP
jgi:peptide/nickel transport system substrate-binding protein